MKLFLSLSLITISVLTISCNNRNLKRETDLKEDQIVYEYFNEIKVYNDILNDLIENKFFYRFLGEERTDLLVKYYRNKY